MIEKRCGPTLIKLFVLWLLVMWISLAVVDFIAGAVGCTAESSIVIIESLVMDVALTLLFLYMYNYEYRPFARDHRPEGREWIFVLLLTLDIIALSFVAQGAVQLLVPGSAAGLIGTYSTGSLPLMLVWAVVAAPVAEELMCRGIAFKACRNSYGFMASAAISSLVWAVIHLSVAQGICAFIIGMLMAYMMEKYDDLWLCIAAHAINNLLAVATAYTGLTIPEGAATEVFIAVGASLVILLTAIVIKHNVSGGNKWTGQ
jgi:membrane protease YdiL (CAAX protease family)